MTEIAADILTGRTERHLRPAPGGALLHVEVVDAFAELQQQAAGAGFDLQIASGFRSFERQLAIWNTKARGGRPVLDSCGQPLDISRLVPAELMFAMLRWSALPGASRHHWGTDMDIWDPAAVAEDYQLQLTPDECVADGPFAPLHRWLDEQIERGATRFYRPYDRDRGGVAAERWHLSYRPLADAFAAALTPALLADTLAHTDIALQATILEHLDEIYERFVGPQS